MNRAKRKRLHYIEATAAETMIPIFSVSTSPQTPIGLHQIRNQRQHMGPLSSYNRTVLSTCSTMIPVAASARAANAVGYTPEGLNPARNPCV